MSRCSMNYVTCHIGYPSTKYTIEVLAADYVLPRIRECVKTDSESVSFVTHSLGGIIVRYIRKTVPEMNFGRVVMLGPPNHGSELVDNLGGWRIFQWVNGPAGQQLGANQESVPNKPGAATFEVGIIAGNKPFLEPFKSYITGQSDGKVSVESAKLEHMSDYVILPVTHSLMMRNKAVIEQTLSLLKHGHFTGAATATLVRPTSAGT